MGQFHPEPADLAIVDRDEIERAEAGMNWTVLLPNLRTVKRHVERMKTMVERECPEILAKSYGATDDQRLYRAQVLHEQLERVIAEMEQAERMMEEKG